MGDNSGSRKPNPQAGSALPGFDPGRIGRVKEALRPLVNDEMDPAMLDAWLTDIAIAAAVAYLGDGSLERPFLPQMLPHCPGADVVVCVGDCGNEPPCPLCVTISSGHDPDEAMRPQ